MEELEKSIYINELFDLYGKLLTESQQEIINLYYRLDLSLSEIADQQNISRNGVYDALKKGIDKMFDYESKLHILEKKRQVDKDLVKLKGILSKSDYELVEKVFKEED